jgi:hypothetical protein
VFGGFRRLRIVPGGVLVFLALHDNRVIAGQPFPVAGGVRIALAEEFLIHRIGWKIVIAFNDNSFVAFGQNNIVPDRFCHFQLHERRQIPALLGAEILFGCAKNR